jgi:hypothetical protein
MLAKLPRRAVLLTALAALLALPASASAAKGSKSPKPHGGTATINLVLLDSTDGLPHYNQWVTFDIATTATTQPWVDLKCFQNGVLVSEEWNGFFDGSLTGRDFGLASPMWTGGAADCTAWVTNPDWTPLGSTSFHVYP